MATEEDATAAGGTEVPPARRSRKRLVILVAALVGVSALGAAGWLAWPRSFGGPTEAAPAPSPARVAAPLGAVVVNLADDPRRFVRVGVSLGVPSPKDAKDVEAAKAQLLDLLISVLAITSTEQLTSDAGRTGLKRVLLERIHGELGLRRVVHVYFTEFVLQ